MVGALSSRDFAAWLAQRYGRHCRIKYNPKQALRKCVFLLAATANLPQSNAQSVDKNVRRLCQVSHDAMRRLGADFAGLAWSTRNSPAR